MIGLLPAAGQATRMNGLPKYLLPVPGGDLLTIHCNRMWAIECEEIFIGANDHNFLALCSSHGEYPIVYRADVFDTMSATVLSLRYDYFYTGFEDYACLFGLPDTYFEDTRVYHKLTDALNAGAQVAVGLFRAQPGQHAKAGMCRVDGKRIVEVVDKPAETDLEWLWGVLAWQPTFWDYIKPEDPHVGYAIPRAIAAGLDVRAVFMDGRYWDCGTPEDYFACIREITREPARS